MAEGDDPKPKVNGRRRILLENALKGMDNVKVLRHGVLLVTLVRKNLRSFECTFDRGTPEWVHLRPREHWPSKSDGIGICEPSKL
jgi:hypothetical protein